MIVQKMQPQTMISSCYLLLSNYLSSAIFRLNFCWSYHRDHTILLSRERVNKGMTRKIVYLCLLLSSLTQPYRENCYLYVNTVALNTYMYLGLFTLYKLFCFTYKLTREATLWPNILNAIRIFAPIVKFSCFHETKQTQNKVERFLTKSGQICFQISLFGLWKQLNLEILGNIQIVPFYLLYSYSTRLCAPVVLY